VSPVNEELPPDEVRDPVIERLVTRARDAMGASERMPIRVLVYFVALAACMTTAPTPANIIGVAALALLALDTAQHRR
jgi:hypothetical protein